MRTCRYEALEMHVVLELAERLSVELEVHGVEWQKARRDGRHERLCGVEGRGGDYVHTRRVGRERGQLRVLVRGQGLAPGRDVVAVAHGGVEAEQAPRDRALGRR